ncbi:MAG: DUF6349 family protein [Solirubrobacteraceae bacterium]
MSATATGSLWELLDHHDELHTHWQETRAESDRKRMAGAWSISLTHPGDGLGAHALRAPTEYGPLCRPTVLCSDRWPARPHLHYRGACLGCGWVSDHTHCDRGAENAAVEDAHDHTHPGWREIPVLGDPPSCETPSSYKRLAADWWRRWGALLPEGWLDRGGPIRTSRRGVGSRHVPRRAPGGGYDLSGDLATSDMAPEAAGGQLGLF